MVTCVQDINVDMRGIIHATSIIGCSISLLFCLLAVLVLACYREKTRLLLIKQQQSVTLVFINIVMLTGFQGLSSKQLCQAATTLLHYFVLACFSWLTADQYFIFKSVVKTKPYVNFMKLFFAAWGFPIPFLIMQLLVGFLLDQKIGRPVLYTCWRSDFVALTLLVPAGGLSIASITMLSITVKSVIKRPAPTTYTRRKTDQAIKYGIKTSSVMIFITVIVWIFGHLLFWYPEVIDFQLIFALSTGLQGLFNFFFYCVFALELDIYVSDKLFSETDDVDEFARNTGSVKLSSINRQDIQNMESLRRPQKSNGNRPFFESNRKIPPMIEEEPLSFQNGTTTPTMTRRSSDPLPGGPPVALATSSKIQLFGTPLQPEMEGQQQNVDPNEAEKLSGDDVTDSNAHYMLSNQVPQRNEEALDESEMPNSPMMPGPMYTISSGSREKRDLKRCKSVPGAPPGYFKGRSLPGTISHGRYNDLSPTQDLERSLAEGLFGHGDPGRAHTKTSPDGNDSPKGRKSLLNFSYGAGEKNLQRSPCDIEDGEEPPFIDEAMPCEKIPTHHKNSLHQAQINTIPAAATTNGIDNHDDDYDVPVADGEVNGRSFMRACADTSNAHDREKSPTHPGFPSTDVRAVNSTATGSSSSQKAKLRPRPSVPSLKFVLNELESLFSNQDLISAADHRQSVQSDSRALPNGQPPEGTD